MAISRYSQAINNSLEQYVPLPFEAMTQAGQAIQQRGDLADQQQMQTEVGLGSMEALAPAYKEFVNSYVNDYKKQSAELLDKVGGNTSNPDFVRGIKRLNTQFTSDPRLQIIKQGNEQVRQNQKIAAQMQAEGKLFINPQFTGKDEQGNLTANAGQIQGVNTLDEWTKAGQIAHQSIEDVGNDLSTNKRNLDRWKQSIMGDVDGQNKLMRAYISQGYTPQQAQQAVKTEIQGLINQYGVVSKQGHFYEEMAYRKQQDALKAKKDNIPPNYGTYFVPSNGERDTQGDNEIPLAGKSNVQFNKPFSGVLTGDRFVFTKGKLNDEAVRKEGSTNIKNGTFVNVSVPYVINNIEGEKSSKFKDSKGQILSKDNSWITGLSTNGIGDGTSSSLDIIPEYKKDEKGNIIKDSYDNPIKTGRNYVWLDDERTTKGWVQGQAFGVYKDNESDATIYKKLNRDETLTYLGKDAGKFSNDGYQEGSRNTLHPDVLKAITQRLKQAGQPVTNEILDDYANRLNDERYYNDRLAPLFSKPGTTKSTQEYYIGQ